MEILGIQYHLGLQVGKSTATYATSEERSRTKKAGAKPAGRVKEHKRTTEAKIKAQKVKRAELLLSRVANAVARANQ